MRPRRFKVERLTGHTIKMIGGQAHHAIHVLRLKEGDPVVLFDGDGAEADGVVEAILSDTLTVRIGERREVAWPQSTLTLALACPKGERADWLVEKCAELGVGTIQFLRCARAQVIPGDGKIDRWRRKADEAAKQSGQAHTLQIEAPVEISAAIKVIRDGSAILFGDLQGECSSLSQVLKEFAKPRDVTIFIGPEGGFADEETQGLIAAKGRAVRLASTILRIETAAIAAASVWADWSLDDK